MQYDREGSMASPRRRIVHWLSMPCKVLTLLLLLGGSVEGAVIFSDDFESYPLGTFPSSGGWTIFTDGAGAGQQYIDNSHAVSGTQSFHSMGGAPVGQLSY